MAFTKVHYTISNLHPKLVVKNYFSSTAAQKFKDFSRTFNDLRCFQALSRALNFKNTIQALSRIFQALYEPCEWKACEVEQSNAKVQPAMTSHVPTATQPIVPTATVPISSGHVLYVVCRPHNQSQIMWLIVTEVRSQSFGLVTERRHYNARLKESGYYVA